MNGKVSSLQKYESQVEREDITRNIEKLEMYRSDFNLFKNYCEKKFLRKDFDSLMLYLHEIITQQQVRLSTFNRRFAGVKYWLTNEVGLQISLEQKIDLKILRSMYNEEQYLHLKPMQGIKPREQSNVLQIINCYDTNQKGDIRKHAICLVNLITANRPSEMVRLKLGDFDLENYIVRVTTVNKDKIINKYLTLECVQAIKNYIKTWGLTTNDYFVGAVDRWGNYTSRQIREVSYNQSIHRWLGFAPYTFRKTQIAAMYQKGANIPTIAQQSGHKSYQTIMDHYLNFKVDKTDKYL